MMTKDKIPTTDRTRIDIDNGKTGDKVPFPDPAAAPLGTDAEAGGHPPSLEERRMEHASQQRANNDPAAPSIPQRPVSMDPPPHYPARSSRRYVIAGAIIVIAIVLVVLAL